MRFLEFVSCCGTASSSRPEIRPEEESAAAAMAARLPEEETRSLVRSPRSHRRRKRGRLGVASSAASAAEWKPSLCSIAEDNVVVTAKSDFDRDRDRRDDHHHQVDRTAGSERLVKRKSNAPRSSRTNVSAYSDDFRRASFPTVIPAFSPTPFMF